MDKLVLNTKTGNIGTNFKEVACVDGTVVAECVPLGSTKKVYWKNYKLMEA